jgi:cytochrome b561
LGINLTTFKNTENHYGILVIGFHWLTVLLLILVYACMDLRGFVPVGGDLRATLKSLHFCFGLSVLGIVCLRLIARRYAGNAPPIQPPVPRWQSSVAGLMHWAIYIFLIVMPILGWLTLSAGSTQINLFGLNVPSLIGPDKAFSQQLKNVHESIATVGYFLVGIHAMAALFHHYIGRDNTLLRMLPNRKRV